MERNDTLRVLVTAPLGVGGITNLMLAIQENLDKSKINFDYLVVHSRKEPQEDRAIALGAKKFEASADNVKIKFLRPLVRIFKVKKICKKNNYKIFHCNSSSPVDLSLIIGAKMGGVKHIIVHSHISSSKNKNILYKIISAICKKIIPIFCDDLWACSKIAGEYYFSKKSLNSKKYLFIPNGINLKKFDYSEKRRINMREKLKINDKLVIGNVSSFFVQKNHTFLLDIFKEIYKKNDKSVLLLCGVGPLQEKMIEKAKELGIFENVIFYGACLEMENMWQAIDIFVMLSLFEGLPVTGIEAQVAGVQCVFSDTITKEVNISNKSVYLSLNNSAEEWADKILKISNYDRTSGLKFAKDQGFDIEDVALKLQNHYLQVNDKIVSKYKEK